MLSLLVKLSLFRDDAFNFLLCSPNARRVYRCLGGLYDSIASGVKI